jgi:uncharacterized protein YjiS (DUF1127 family)
MSKRMLHNWFVIGGWDIFATWRERVVLRRALAEMLEANPHMIDDIGMTKQEVEAEITKRFWQE